MGRCASVDDALILHSFDKLCPNFSNIGCRSRITHTCITGNKHDSATTRATMNDRINGFGMISFSISVYTPSFLYDVQPITILGVICIAGDLTVSGRRHSNRLMLRKIDSIRAISIWHNQSGQTLWVMIGKPGHCRKQVAITGVSLLDTINMR
ncbi:MAG: hypothetical protein BWY75_00236 [bacterium ADurb.Bin425]|nr:MAG: hypothetical protein BWY75_00236 [bacterium ADurb.Bin425]